MGKAYREVFKKIRQKIAAAHQLTACLRFASLTQIPLALRKHAKRYMQFENLPLLAQKETVNS